MNKKAAVLYDFLQVNGGAEAVTIGICERFKDVDLVTAFVNENAFDKRDIQCNSLISLTSSTSLPGWLTIKTCRAFEKKTKFLQDYETLIFSGSNAPLAICNSRAQQNVYYCHTPPRFVYDLKDYYLESVQLWQKPLLKFLINRLQPQYESAVRQMDLIYANSINVQQRLAKFLDVKSEVLYPPCKIDRFNWVSSGDYFLSTARLEDYKRIELIVKAFAQMPDKKLVVTSGGSQFERLRDIANNCKNIFFTNWVTERELTSLVGNCLATIYIPNDEDFGMSPVESMGAGKPVIGVDEGGVRETILHDETGWLLPSNPTVEQLVDLVYGLSKAEIIKMKPSCIERSLDFSEGKFYAKFKELTG